MTGKENYTRWVGKSQCQTLEISALPMQLLSATLNKGTPASKTGSPVPDGWHWVYFLPVVNSFDLGLDGHAKKGGFLPPIDLPARMWAGGKFIFNKPMCIGDRVTKRSTVKSINEKHGRSGKLVFVTVRHEFFGDGNDVLFIEDHDIVYKQQGLYKKPIKQKNELFKVAQWQQTIMPDPVLLFRFSALTFNGHRIHYDRDYCQHDEGYPGLVFHGPLTALLLLLLIKDNNPEVDIKRFSYRGLQPLFDDNAFCIKGLKSADQAEAWAETPDGMTAMTATAEFLV